MKNWMNLSDDVAYRQSVPYKLEVLYSQSVPYKLEVLYSQEVPCGQVILAD